MTAKQSVELSCCLGARTIVPAHYDGWSHFSEGRQAIQNELAEASEDLRSRYHLLTIGIGATFAA